LNSGIRALAKSATEEGIELPKLTLTKLRLPICEIFQLFRLIVYFISPLTDVRNFSDRK